MDAGMADEKWLDAMEKTWPFRRLVESCRKCLQGGGRGELVAALQSGTRPLFLGECGYPFLSLANSFKLKAVIHIHDDLSHRRSFHFPKLLTWVSISVESFKK